MKGFMYCVIKCIARGNQARVKNADLHHPSCTVEMLKRKSASPVRNVLSFFFHFVYSNVHIFDICQEAALALVRK